jgi:dUTP pyrophosphatase
VSEAPPPPRPEASLRVRRLDPRARLPTRAHPGDAGLDLHALDGAQLAPGQRASVATGLAIEVPVGQAALVLPRSGLAARHGISLANAPGLIDAGYRGELRVLLLNTDVGESFEIAPGDRIAQLILIRVELPEPVEVDSLETSARGAGGFGSSGGFGPPAGS